MIARSNSMLVRVKVLAGAKKEVVTEIAPAGFQIAVREEAERNQANLRVIAILAVRFRVREKDVSLVKGHRSPSKLFTISAR